MAKRIAFLRGINVSGQKKLKMVELREQLKSSSFKNVETYIQSGNLIFDSDSNDSVSEEKEIHGIIKKEFGFDVPVLVIAPSSIETILKNNPFSRVKETKNLYFTLLHQKPLETNISRLNLSDYPNEEFHITDNCVYLNCKNGAGKAKLNNNIIERKLQVMATTRNLRTMLKMLELAQ
ncbi:DUF1697 domain-containing protein [Croceivirga thetidis]|uniref:DUF1697 domain-containing protein n=1 Tax=Croceivirga thetidis TaxID=2721623 RepID=A0ABX1GNX8_9FLAO|nr:DUF1697 domain-containing protein [Croceivirga thetidis]NKI31636.1 DUF1697 domain-containing protein [Croceivirga thetidis]